MRARLCLAAWVGWRGERPLEAEPVQVDRQAFPEVLAAFGSPGQEWVAFVAVTAKPYMRDASLS